MRHLRRKAIFAAALSLTAFQLPAQAAEFTAAQKTEIESTIRTYLLSHPELLREVSVELEKRQKAEEADVRGRVIAENKQALFDSANQAVIGNPKGKITLVEFFDYNCGYCKRALNDLLTLIKSEPELRVVLKDFPVLGPNSVEAARVAFAVRKQASGEKFLEFHQKLMLSRGPNGKEQALAVARELGLDMDRLQKDMKDPSVQAGLEETMKIADELNLTGTPSYVIGDEAVVGAVGATELKKRIDAVAKCGKASC
jgi:protein-disulfide isomerase